MMQENFSHRNPDGLFVNTSDFSEAAKHFKKYNCYTDQMNPSSYEYIDYWTRETKRIVKGHTVGGVKITGEHYFYLNYTQIKVSEKSGKSKKKSFPRFYDGDYDYFWVREIAKRGVFDAYNKNEESTVTLDDIPTLEQATHLKILYEKLNLHVQIVPDYLKGGYDVVVAKSRRKGYSYKNAAVGAYNFITIPNSTTIYVAADKVFLYPDAIFTMTLDHLKFLNNHTAWVSYFDEVDKMSAKKNSEKYKKDGRYSTRGFMSSLLAITVGDGAGKIRGKDGEDIIYEESGSFGTPGLLKDCVAATQDAVKDGLRKTGLITVFGTSGELDKGSVDYVDFITRPLAFGFLPFIDPDDDDGSYVGFHHLYQTNLVGMMDKDGNSKREEAVKIHEELIEEKIKNGASNSEINKFRQENPTTIADATAKAGDDPFKKKKELNDRLTLVKRNGINKLKGTPVDLVWDKDGKAKILRSYLDWQCDVMDSYINEPENKKSRPIIFEMPLKGSVKNESYLIGYDPYRQDKGSSNASIIVMKTFVIGSNTKYKIVAKYKGREDSPEEIHNMALLLADMYNTQVMYENEVPGMKAYCKQKRKLDFLASQPDDVIKDNVKNPSVDRVYGCHMNTFMKVAAEAYVKDLLNEVAYFDEDGSPVSFIDQLESVSLLEELVNYDRDKNLDDVSALFMVAIQLKQLVIDTERRESKPKKSVYDLLEQTMT